MHCEANERTVKIIGLKYEIYKYVDKGTAHGSVLGEGPRLHRIETIKKCMKFLLSVKMAEDSEFRLPGGIMCALTVTRLYKL